MPDNLNYKSPAGGDRVGTWILKHRIDTGGNGEVWFAEGSDGKSAAIKILMKTKPVAYTRFKQEVEVLKLVAGVSGILPVLDSDLPADRGDRRPWYAMPVAIPLLEAIKDKEPREKAQFIAEAAETMAELHTHKIYHRDIKPANLLLFEGRCHIGDFGLVDYPEKADLTAPKQDLGSRWTMAPEVRREHDKADPMPADVYSLAKTLWIVLTRELKGFDGQYDPRGDLSVKHHCGESYITSLEQLLIDSTQTMPRRRPSMASFASRLREWIRISDRFHEHNRLQWVETQRGIFPATVPARAIWENLDDIVVMLNILGETSNLNHAFFPDGGGLDFMHASLSNLEPGCIELLMDNIVFLVKPAKLMFESFSDDPQWNYFRLETGDLKPSGVYSDVPYDLLHEELTEVGGEFYADRSCWDEGSYEGNPLPDGSRVIIRYLGGAFVIFQKTSIYNKIPNTYDGRHNKMDADQFRAYIASAVVMARKRKNDPD
jgi:serine/threonine-protein kinase